MKRLKPRHGAAESRRKAIVNDRKVQQPANRQRSLQSDVDIGRPRAALQLHKAKPHTLPMGGRQCLFDAERSIAPHSIDTGRLSIQRAHRPAEATGDRLKRGADAVRHERGAKQTHCNLVSLGVAHVLGQHRHELSGRRSRRGAAAHDTSA